MTATVRAIARAAGVSHATVSRVLNRSSAVRESTRARVLAEIARLDYTPNHAARALATRRTRTIGAVVPTVKSSINAAWLDALESTLERHGYALTIATTGFDQDTETRRGLDLIGLGAEALSVVGLEHDDRLLRAAQSRGVPIVCASVFEPDFPLPTIGSDNRAMAQPRCTISWTAVTSTLPWSRARCAGTIAPGCDLPGLWKRIPIARSCPTWRQACRSKAAFVRSASSRR